MRATARRRSELAGAAREMVVVHDIVAVEHGCRREAEGAGVPAMWSAAHESAAEQPDDAPLDRFAGAAARWSRSALSDIRTAGRRWRRHQSSARARLGPAGDGHDLRIGRRERGVDAPSDLAPALAIDILVAKERDALEIRGPVHA